MKVIYLSTGLTTAGVHKKLNDKVMALRAKGIDCTMSVVVPKDYQELPGDFTDFIRVEYTLSKWFSTWPVIWRFSVLWEQMILYRSLLSYLKDQAYDLILMRYPIADFFLWRFMKNKKAKVVFEHNTLEHEELLIRSNDSFWYTYFLWSEKYFGKRVRMLSAGMIGVTPEISARQTQLSNGCIPVTTISNGIAVERIPMKKPLIFDGTQLNVLLLAGSEAPWHGIDILLNSIENYTGQCKVQCFIAGNISNTIKQRIQGLAFVSALPSLSGAKLDELVNQCHLGVGTLGLTKFLNQASTLKVREYWSRGLPLILGYDDVDLETDSRNNQFYYRIQITDERCFDFNAIVDFARSVYSIPNINATIRASALRQIDYSVKADQYASFLNTLAK